MKNEFNQGITVKAFISDHIRKDSTSTVFLRVIIDRVKREFNLNVYWPPEKFDKLKQIALPRHPKDNEVESVNLVINEAKGKANRIKLRYFSDERILSLDIFQREFENYESRDNFLFYWLQKQHELLKKGIISPETQVRHNTNRNRLVDYNKGENFLSMADLTPDFIKGYQKWLRKKRSVIVDGFAVPKKELSHNTSVNALKTLLTYINHAREDGFKIKNPFEKISLIYQAGERSALDRIELNSLKELLINGDLETTEREVLRKFLFSCYTSIRISDNALVNRGNIIENVLYLNTKKGRNSGKRIAIPLPKYALELINEREGLLFEKIADQTCNDWLKVIAHKAGIKKRLTFHVSRDTFATLFIELGGDVATLKEVLGHTNIQTTMIYVKMSEGRKATLMNNFDNL